MQVTMIKCTITLRLKQLCQTTQQLKGEEGKQGKGIGWSPPSPGYWFSFLPSQFTNTWIVKRSAY